MKNVKLLVLSAILVMSVGSTPIETNYVYAGEEEDEEVGPGGPDPDYCNWWCEVRKWFQ